jgi:hypothetical protein
MKKQNLTLIIIATLLFMSRNFVFAQVSVEEAKESIRSFEGNPKLDLPNPKEFYNPFLPSAKHCYVFRLPNGTSYEVDKKTGWVVYAFYSSSKVQSESDKFISSDQAVRIARSFLEKRSIVYQRFGKNMIFKVFDGPTDDSYRILFVEKIPSNGAHTSNQCELIINAITGEVETFIQRWEEKPHPNRSKKPIYSSFDAANKIAAYFKFEAWDFVDEPELLALPANWVPFKWRSSGSGLVWNVEIVGNGGRGVLGHVDALRGTILMANRFFYAPSPFPKVDRPKIRLWVHGTDRIKETMAGPLHIADGFALKGFSPIIDRYNFSSKFTWLPIEVFKRFGAQVKREKDAIIVLTGKRSKVIEDFREQRGIVYLPARLLEELFPDKILAVTTHKEGWVRIIIRNKEYLNLFEDLKEEIPIIGQNLRYKTKK